MGCNEEEDRIVVDCFGTLHSRVSQNALLIRLEVERERTDDAMERLNGVLNWIDDRFPLTATWKKHLSEYYAPKNLNVWYNFGSLALLILAMQLVTGILLTMHYKPDAARAFASVEYIMRDVPWGWLIRYTHSTGASMFFVVIYLHMFRGLIYGSYRKPRELVWLLGMLIYLGKL